MSNSSRSTPLVGGRSGGRNGLIELRIRPHRAWWVQLLLAVWRWRAEILGVVVGLVLAVKLADRVGSFTVAGLILVGLALAVLLVPSARRYVVRHVWCTITRHRLRLFFVEAGVYNRSGRLPAIWWVRPTRVGERAWIALSPGLSAGNLEDRLDALAATCWARDARITPVRAVVTFIRVDIVRRDPLVGGRRPRPIPNPLVARRSDAPATYTAVPTPRDDDTTPTTPAAEPVPVGPQSFDDDVPDAATVLINGEDLSDYVDL